MNYLERSEELFEEAVEIRRHLHRNPETGLKLPTTKAFVREKLESFGYEVADCGEGLTTTIGSGGKVILLRADMDGLPIVEETGLDFASGNENMHACGHDMHTTSLLIAAKMLKENESEIEGTIKFMFQPGEEVFLGGKNMIEAGILENPKVDVGLGFHVAAGHPPLGLVAYNTNRPMMYSSDNFRITIKGKSSHGAYPNEGIDAINIGVNIYNALMELIARETKATDENVLTIGVFDAGTALNIIPEIAILEGTLRSNSKEARDFIISRMEEMIPAIAKTFRGSATFEILANVPALSLDPDFTEKAVGYIKDLNKDAIIYDEIIAAASEDFASVAEEIPAAFLFLSAGFEDSRGDFGVHHPEVQFNEEFLKLAPAYFAEIACRWLAENK